MAEHTHSQGRGRKISERTFEYGCDEAGRVVSKKKVWKRPADGIFDDCGIPAELIPEKLVDELEYFYRYNAGSAILWKRTRKSNDPEENGDTVEEEFDEAGRCVSYKRIYSATEASGSRTSYDSQGRMCERKYVRISGGAERLTCVQTFTYDADGNGVTERSVRYSPKNYRGNDRGCFDVSEKGAEFTYDAQGRKISASFKGENVWYSETYAYDAQGNPHCTGSVSISHFANNDDAGDRTECDANGRPVHTRYADGTEEWFTYDEHGNKTCCRQRGANGCIREETSEYDSHGNLVATVMDETCTDWYELEYDATGNVVREQHFVPETVAP